MKSAVVSLTFEPDDSRRYNLPADGSPSLLYVFTPDRTLGARAYSAVGQDFAPGTRQEGVRLDFWADDEWTDVVVPGATFTIWYGSDVGQGIVHDVVPAPVV
jgi:hypothetical protein